MASFKVNGMSELLSSLDEIANTPDSVFNEMLNAHADVTATALKRTASTMLQGPYYKGGVAGSILKDKIIKTATGRRTDLNFKGTQHGERLAAIAYLNEYGVKGQPGRPFIQVACEQSSEQGIAAQEQILDRFLESKGV